MTNDAPVNASFLSNFAQRGLLGSLETLKVTLEKAPLNTASPIASRDQRRIGNSVTHINDDASRAGFRANRQVRAARAHESRPTRGFGNPASALKWTCRHDSTVAGTRPPVVGQGAFLACLRTMSTQPTSPNNGPVTAQNTGTTDIPTRREIGRARVGKECRSRWSPYH